MHILRAALAVIFLASLPFLGGCDLFNVETRVVTYTISGFGEYPAVRADKIEFTDSQGRLVEVRNELLPWSRTFEITAGTQITLRAERRAQWNAVGLRASVAVDGEERWTDEEPGMDSSEHHTQIVSITRTLP